MTFPSDFNVPTNEGGPGKGQHVGGFGGNTSRSRDEHRAAVRNLGKAPVILLHGNAAEADGTQWNLLMLRDKLVKVGYLQELIWAPDYLGTPIVSLPPPVGDIELGDISTPHTDNVGQVRAFIRNVLDYLGVQVVDIIAHSLGCTLAYAVFRGLKEEPDPPWAQEHPVIFDQPKMWNNVGTFVALAGAFHGFGDSGLGAIGEWKTSSKFMSTLLTETDGGGGETPFGDNKPQTPSSAHNITYFCGVARGDFVDAAKLDTGKLAGAINKVYTFDGDGQSRHKQIKESQMVFDDFSPHLNSVPPVVPVSVVVDKDSGSFDTPHRITVHVEPSDKALRYVANKVTKAVPAGILVTAKSEADKLEGTLRHGEALTLTAPGMWEVVFSAEGTADVRRTYWLGMEPIEANIVMDNSAPFERTLDVMATTTRGTLYHSLTGDRWTEGSVVTITSDAAPRFIAIDSEGIASETASKTFKKAVTPSYVSATAVEHYALKRIDTDEFLAYGQHFGFTTPFTLHSVNGRWVPQLADQEKSGAKL